MDGSRSTTLIKNELIRYISSLGLTVKTVTKARGNKGFFKEGRIDVSKNLDDVSAVKVLVHEFAHYVNYKLDNKLKSLETVLGRDDEQIRAELLEVTKFVDDNAHCRVLNAEREKLKLKIKNLTETIKDTYPKFSLSEDFREFKRYSRWSDLRYLEKYDRVKVHTLFSFKTYSLSNVRKDFPDIPDVFVDYLNLKSEQRKRAKISRRITRLGKYYSEPCELFARFVEGLYVDTDRVKKLAPNAYNCFMENYQKNNYPGMREMFSILGLILV
ncbi:MAG: hypothetical protein K6E29_05265 [Cyanobacteria bacterium RUI128]|nr:hypothetical protein [Cyanobacteria bacterium RUI128]